MKILYFSLLLLFMVVSCKADNNSTTTPFPKIANSTTVISSITTKASTAASTTSLPMTTTKSPSITTKISSTTTSKPLTTTTRPSTTTTPYDESKNFDFQVCGDVTKTTDCSCINGTLDCRPLEKPCYRWYCYSPYYYPSFNSTNIKILNESFVVKTARFFDNNLTTLQKDKVLRGNEHTVEVLFLYANKIKNIENGTFNKFVSLKELVLSNNNLKNLNNRVLSRELGSTLEKLDISYNEFNTTLEFDFSNLVTLKSLKLNSNRLLGTNDSFLKYVFPKALENLTALSLQYCSIGAIGDETFINLRSLESLLLYSNPLVAFPKSIYSLESLKSLDLDGTWITSLNYTDANATMKLEKLLLCNTQLRMIDDCAFCNFPELKQLHLYQNPYLSYIHENAFGYAYNETSPPLESFSIEQCNLSTIPEELLNWHNVSNFGLGINPFICNCSMAWLINDLLSPTHSINLKNIAPRPYQYSWEPKIVDFKCFAPYALKDIPFIQLSRNFCPNEIKKERPIKEKIVLVTEPPSPFFISWFHIVVGITLSLTFFTFGIFFMLFLRYICRRPKKLESGFINQNFHDDLIQEDYDDEKAL